MFWDKQNQTTPHPCAGWGCGEGQAPHYPLYTNTFQVVVSPLGGAQGLPFRLALYLKF